MKTHSIRDRLLASTMVGGTALLVLAAVPVLTLVAPTNAYAQSQTGNLRVVITDGGRPISGATVTVSSPDSLVTRTGITGADGLARVPNLDPATNYTVQVSAPGYNNFSASNVAVVTGRDLSVGYGLTSTSGASDLGDIIVTGVSLAAVDVTSAIVGTTLTLDTVESLPTGRSYQSYLQLVPGTKPGSNPSSRSGVNYSDVGGSIGSSTDNVYYLDGVNVTDPSTGTFGTNFNSEIIQEQQVIVGGVPAQFAGGSGLISRVVTKSGSNDWHGSVNYYFQNDGLVAEDEHNTSGGFSTYDTAITLGGPIMRDRLWIFGSYQKKFREDEVLDITSGALLRTVEQESSYSFLKATWQVTNDDRLSVSYFNDPYETTGSNSASTLNNRDFVRVQGGDNYKVDYQRTWGNLLINAHYFSHESEVSNFAANTAVRDDVSFRGPGSTLAQRSLGGSGSNIETFRNSDEIGVDFEYFLETDLGTHTFQTGYSRSNNSYQEDSSVPGAGGMRFRSITSGQPNRTFADFTSSGPGWTSRPFAQVDIPRIITGIQNSGNAALIAAVAANSGNPLVIEASDINAITFNNTAGNPYGNINAYRTVTTSAPYEVTSEGQTFYFQDTWTLDQLTLVAGVRAEKWEHFASDGSQTATFDWDLAPRLSVVYDLVGDGRSKLFGFVGRYYDPVRNNMSDFAGALTGPILNEQINVNGTWVTFRVRGGVTTPDALFSPTTKTPYTDEFMLGYSTTFGSSIGFTASVTHRQTRDILEDFDLALYSDPNATAADGAHGYAYPGSPFYIPLAYFGYATTPNSNYVIGTLPGGERNYTGFELVLTKYRTDNWFGQVSYTNNSAEGNSNSDSNADFQGDWIALDPRAPNVYGNQPGNIEHQFKAYAAYEFDFGIEVSGVFNWNSGAAYTAAQLISGRYFAPMDAPYSFWGVTDSYLKAGFVGQETTPAYYTFDMRFKYDYDLPIGQVELFLDVFNVLNNQAATDEQKLISGSGQYAFQEANNWVSPRRAYVGARFSF